jgi:AraC family transcriptional regulator of adaptative response / DNA-3-methyladenine glycosylase II
VSERHLRRAMERELGVSPLELAQTHRLLLAKCLLTDTRLPVTRVAFASGFQSLRRFNSVFRQRYRMSRAYCASVLPSRACPRRPPLHGATGSVSHSATAAAGLGCVARHIAGDTPPGVGLVDGSRYARTVALDGCRGVVLSRPQRAAHTRTSISRCRFCPRSCRSSLGSGICSTWMRSRR